MKVIWIAAFALLLSACSTHFSYNNLDWLIHWYVDDYVDLNRTQKKRFDEKFEKWMAWHRAEELARYQRHLQDIRSLLEQDSITKEQVLAQIDSGREHWIRLRTHILPDLAELAMSLSQQQVDELFSSLEEKNAEQEQEHRAMTRDESVEEIRETLEDELKDFIGRLTDQQKALARSAAIKFSPNRIEWIRYRRAFQSAARTMLNRKDSNPDFKVDFVKLLNKPEAFQHDLYVRNSAQNLQVFAQFVVDTFPTLTPKQKKRLFGELDNLIEDLSELRKNRPRT